MDDETTRNEKSDAEREALEERVSVMNARALAENLADLRQTTDARFQAQANEILTLRNLVQAQSQVIGDAIQRVSGSGSTVPDPEG